MGFVVGMVGLTLTVDITPIGDQWVEDSAMGMFAATGVAAASGGVVTAALADTDVVGTGINIVVADLVSSLMGIAAIIIGLAGISTVNEFLGWMLLLLFWGLPIILFLSAASIAVAMVFGMVTYGVRRWWRESAMGSAS